MSKTKLKDPDITNVDLVDRPANPGARIMLFKRDNSADEPRGLLQRIAKKLGLTDEDIGKSDDQAETFDEAFSEESARRALDEMWMYTAAFQDSVRSIICDVAITDKQGMISGSLDQFTAAVLAAVPGWLKTGMVTKAVLLDVARLKKMATEIQTCINENTKGDESKMEEVTKRSVEDQALIAKLEKEIADLKAAAMFKKSEAPTNEDVLKSLTPEVRKMFDDMESRAKTAETVAKKTLDDESSKSFIAKAAGYSNLGIKSDEFGAVLKSISEKDPESMAKLEAVLAAANEAVAKGDLFKETGSARSGGKALGGNATWAKIQESAKNAITKAGTPMSEEQAVAKYLETTEGSAMYNEYLKERDVK